MEVDPCLLTPSLTGTSLRPSLLWSISVSMLIGTAVVGSLFIAGHGGKARRTNLAGSAASLPSSAAVLPHDADAMVWGGKEDHYLTPCHRMGQPCMKNSDCCATTCDKTTGFCTGCSKSIFLV